MKTKPQTSDDTKASRQQIRPGGRTARNTAQIEQVAVKLLVEQGYQGLTFQAISKETGINRSTLYRRWPTRAELAIDVMLNTIQGNVVFEDYGSLEKDLRDVLNQTCKFIASPVGSTFIIATLEMQQLGDLTLDKGFLWKERSKLMLSLFERAKARGELGQDFDSEIMFALLVGSFYFRLIVMGEKPDQKWVERVLKQFFHMRS
ncbi:TetR/AcrR family transcriptional regulator [Pseudomonas sp. FEN]|uniref:TetR/AcrR family transcriptional regulator n=1 Tax=Pseudomonas sp. FEN TaxID=2767468 RepID=UPI00174905E1|nr:TetR/AcrR family transcriptional regulator [Pseudomonas sp. FEN]